MDNQIVLDSKTGAFLGFRPTVSPLPIEGPPVPEYGEVSERIGDLYIERSPDGSWAFATDWDESARLSEHEVSEVIAAIARMRATPFPIIGWRYPDGRYERAT